MDIKQKQANVAEAMQARRQAEASAHHTEIAAQHSRIILLFTVVTIIFLPMSFLATWFGINAQELSNGSKLPIGTISAIIFPTSFVIIVLALLLAFHSNVRRWVIGIVNTTLRLVLCHSTDGEPDLEMQRLNSPN